MTRDQLEQALRAEISNYNSGAGRPAAIQRIIDAVLAHAAGMALVTLPVPKEAAIEREIANYNAATADVTRQQVLQRIIGAVRTHDETTGKAAPKPAPGGPDGDHPHPRPARSSVPARRNNRTQR